MFSLYSCLSSRSVNKSFAIQYYFFGHSTHLFHLRNTSFQPTEKYKKPTMKFPKPTTISITQSYMTLLLGILIFSPAAIASTAASGGVAEHNPMALGNRDMVSPTVKIPATGVEMAMKAEKTNPKDHRVYQSGAGRMGVVMEAVWVGILGMVVVVGRMG